MIVPASVNKTRDDHNKKGNSLSTNKATGQHVLIETK